MEESNITGFRCTELRTGPEIGKLYFLMYVMFDEKEIRIRNEGHNDTTITTSKSDHNYAYSTKR
jgi:hypothetical protein